MTKIFVAGHNGMVGAALVRRLRRDKAVEVITVDRNSLDLTDSKAVYRFFQDKKPDQIYLAAAKVGGIQANTDYPADFISENLAIQNSVITSAIAAGINKLLFLGSSCIYPKLADQPIVESALLSGLLEPTNEPYGIAKIAGIKLCESFNRQYGVDYRSVMPTNLYGENDNFHLQHSHVVPAMLRRFHEAKVNRVSQVEIWGTGNAMREFLHVDDMASACIHIMNLPKSKIQSVLPNPMLSHINVGTGIDCTIRELAEIISEVVGYDGDIVFDLSKPDGTPRKLLSVELLKELGWTYSISLKDGLINTYDWFLENEKALREH